MTLTHWFLLFGGLTIIAITIDGVRRMVSRPSTLAIDIDETLQNLSTDEFRAELPNGGARVVEQATATLDEISQAPAVVATEIAPVVAAQTSLVETSQTEPTTQEVAVATLDEASLDLDIDQQEVLSVAEFDIALAAPEVEILSADLDEELVTELEAITDLDAEVVEALEVSADLDTDVVAELDAEVTTELEVETASNSQDLAPEFDLQAPQETQPEALVDGENPLVAAFDPTRPVHETVESHKMVQSDMFADADANDMLAEEEAMDEWQEYAELEDDTSLALEEATEAEEVVATIEDPAEDLATPVLIADDLTYDEDSQTAAYAVDAEEPTAVVSEEDILLTDTGLDEVENQADTLGARLAKVTSFSFGKKLLENRRKQIQEAEALQAMTQSEGSVVANVEQILTIIVAAKDAQGFYGNNLQGLVEACGMVHGNMDLFHRHEDGLTQGQTQFSMANMTESGAFDMDTLADVHTAGVVFFMTLPSANDSIRAFDYMVETAQCLANNLGGELYDENRSVLRAQTVEHYRQRIREFERQRLARRAHGGN